MQESYEHFVLLLVHLYTILYSSTIYCFTLDSIKHLDEVFYSSLQLLVVILNMFFRHIFALKRVNMTGIHCTKHEFFKNVVVGDIIAQKTVVWFSFLCRSFYF